ncbi:hypothetical protein KSS87_002313 [Heliosperma pusillum]|nr:hypothetical protein KSS87_002313 [Heliosperma pusillum]
MASLDRAQSARESTSTSVASSRRWSTSWSTTSGSIRVLAIECIRGTSRAEEWSGGLLQSGDIVEEIEIGQLKLRAPFKDGNSGVQKQLHICFKNKVSSIRVRVRRGELNDSAELNACIVPDARKKNKYVLRAIDDPNYAIAFFDRTESECLRLQASRTSRLNDALNSAQLQDGYVAYPWERKMQEMLQVPKSSSFMSILFLPKVSDVDSDRYNDLEDTLAKANAWFNSAQSSGVPILFTNIQTESLLTKISGETASSRVNTSSLSDLPKLANASLYGFEDYHGVDIGVVRAVRLWYSPIEECLVEIEILEGDMKLGFVISRTEEGFIYISSVLQGSEDVPSERSGLNALYREAMRDSKLLVISRVNNQKVLPWIVSSTGAIQCFDTVSLCQKLSLHRHAKVPIILHVLMWDNNSPSPRRHIDRRPAPLAMPFPNQLQSPVHSNGDHNPLGLSSSNVEENEIEVIDDESNLGLPRDTAGEESFRRACLTVFGKVWGVAEAVARWAYLGLGQRMLWSRRVTTVRCGIGGFKDVEDAGVEIGTMGVDRGLGFVVVTDCVKVVVSV